MSQQGARQETITQINFTSTGSHLLSILHNNVIYTFEPTQRYYIYIRDYIQK